MENPAQFGGPAKGEVSVLLCAWSDGDQHALARFPRAGNRMRPHVTDHLLVDALGRAAQCELAQCGQISRLEVVVEIGRAHV